MGGVGTFTEQIYDADGRPYLIEFQFTQDLRRAIAYCRRNPWANTPNAGQAYTKGHVREDGLICVGPEQSANLETSRYAMPYVRKRVEYWCTAFSHLVETGEFPNL